jgi:hypothetical protein
MAEAPTPPAYFGGLDLGQLTDYSALCVAERTERPAPEGQRPVRHYAVRHLKRWPLRTAYADVVADVVRLYAAPPLAGAPLVVDRTGVGVAVFEQLRRARPAARLVPATITAGKDTACGEDGCWSVPKRELAGVLQVLLGTGRLKIAPALPLAKVLGRELQTFKVKVNVATGSESFEAWREKDKDDLVLATALPLWYAERAQKQVWLRIADEGRAQAGPETSYRPDGDGWTWDSLYGWQRAVLPRSARTPADLTADKPGPGWRRWY